MNMKLWMGEYYLSEDDELVRTVTKARSVEDGKSLVVYVTVGENGEVKDTLAMSEDEFRLKFSRTPAQPLH